MIGTYVRGLNHLRKLIENDKKFFILQNGRKQTYFCEIRLFTNCNGFLIYNNFIGDKPNNSDKFNRAYPIYGKDDNPIFDFYREIILVNDDFENEYNKFLSQNVNTVMPIINKYHVSDNEALMYIYAICNGSKNFFTWAIKHVFGESRLPLSTLKRIMQWNETYGQLVSRLSKHTITAYTSPSEITDLLKEMSDLRQIKRANDAINMFNTQQKRLLRGIEKTEAQINILGKFGNLSTTKKRNFVRKMSTIDSADEILKQMSFLVDVHFEWNKNSLIDYIGNSENIDCEIVKNDGNVVLVKVNDFDTIKRLAKTTNWCISKNKSYWNGYVSEGQTQYMLFNFNKREDDKLSIVGFTTKRNVGVFAAHDFINNNLMGERSAVGANLRSYISQYINTNNIYNILTNNDISESELTEYDKPPYEWNSKSVLKFLEKCIGKCYVILNSSDNKLVISAAHKNIGYFLGETYFDNTDEYIWKMQHLLFFDFNLSGEDPMGLTYCWIIRDTPRCYDRPSDIYNRRHQLIHRSFNSVLLEHNLPLDIISVINDVDTTLSEAFVYDDTDIIKKILSKSNISAKDLSNATRNMIKSSLIRSVCSLYSCDVVDAIYESGKKIADILDDKELSSVCSRIFREMDSILHESTFIRTTPSTLEIEDLHNGKSPNLLFAEYVCLFEIFNKIIETEHTSDVFKDINASIGSRAQPDDKFYLYFAYKAIECADFDSKKDINNISNMLSYCARCTKIDKNIVDVMVAKISRSTINLMEYHVFKVLKEKHLKESFVFI